jgi:type IV pilus assembly protein PilO
MDFKNPKTQKMIIAVVVLAAVIYFYFFAAFLPFGFRAQVARYAELRQTYDKLTSDLAKARQMVNDLPKLRKEYEDLHAAWMMAKELLPEEKEVASLLSKVTIAGQQAGVKFTLFKPGLPLSREYYVEYPVEVGVVGGFHEVASFMSEIANLSRIVNVSKLRLETFEKGKPDETVFAKFIASAYTLKRGAQDVSSPTK